MPTAPNGAEIFVGAGKVYLDRFDSNGNRTGLRFLGNCPKFEITPSVDSTKVVNYTRKTRTTLANINKSQTHTVAIDAQEFSPKNVALALFGADAIYTQTGGTVTGEQLASTTPSGSMSGIPAVGAILKTAQRNISATTLKATTSTTPTTLVLGTDYEIEDAISGLIRILSVSSFPGGITGLTLDYTAAAMTTSAGKTMITAASQPSIYGYVYFIGDPVQGRAMDVELWKVELNTSAAIAFIGDDTSVLSFTGEILDDSINHESQPFYRTIER